jgi:beta-N-acetylhexosaminidase
LPATFSSKWITNELRGRLDYQGLVVSDDVMMGALSQFGEPADRVIRARQAGCDLILLCNDDMAADAVLSGGGLPPLSQQSRVRLNQMRRSDRRVNPATVDAARKRLATLN